MLRNHFKYTLKVLLSSRSLIFWTFAFPLLLGTFFSLAFSDIEKNETLAIIDVAVVENEEFTNNMMWKNSFLALSDEESDSYLFHTQYVSLEEAKHLLEEKEITGYLLLTGDTYQVAVHQNGINETVFQYAVEEIYESGKVIENLVEQSIQKIDVLSLEPIYEQAYRIYTSATSSVVDDSSSNMSYTMVEFYTLIAMTCLYGGVVGMVAINNNLANMSSKGKRVSISPISKGKMIFSSALASYVVEVLGVFLLFLYTIFVLHVDYGSHLFWVILLALIGSFTGLAFGILIAVLLKCRETTKDGIIISITMFCCFLSGMMGITMKYVIDKNLPFLNFINPANMITDGLYSLYYYGVGNRYFINVVSLLGMGVVMLLVASFYLRRQKYDSI